MEEVRTAELIAALSLATDLGHGSEFEHGLRSTVLAMRLAGRLGVDHRRAAETYYGCMLLYVGCTAEAHLGAQVFGEAFEHLGTFLEPVVFGSAREAMTGLLRAVAAGRPGPAKAVAIAQTLPKATRSRATVFAGQCEAGAMLCERLTIPAGVTSLLAHVFERWDGKGEVLHERGEAIPLPIRIAHVAHDADVQCRLGGVEHAARVIAGRAGSAFDPAVAACLVDGAADLLAGAEEASAWDEALAAEPRPHGRLRGGAIDGALAAMGDFADLPSPYLTGHASRVARLASDAAARCGLDAGQATALRRSACVHDLGRVAIPVRIWQKPGPLTPDEWERVRLHPYLLERLLHRSPFLAALIPVAGAHHEHMDGSGYHRGVGASALTPSARVLAAADAYCAMVSARPHRPALDRERAAAALSDEAAAGRLDAAAVAAVLEASGQAVPRIALPAGLTEREAEVLGLLARGLQTKQVAHRLGITAKTADHHVQHVYAKIGVSTRAGATVFAMQHGLAP